MDTIFQDFYAPLYSFHARRHWNDEISLHFHTHFELDAIKSGGLTMIANGTRIDYTGACILLYKPYCYHVNIDHGIVDYDTTVFHFDRSVAEQLAQFVNIEQLFQANLTLLPLENSLYDEAFSLLGAYSEQSERETERRLILAALLDLVSRNLELTITDREKISEISYIRDVSEYISQHFTEKITADGLAKQFLVSRQKLDLDFKLVMLTTLKQYILDIRIANSVRLMSLGKKVIDVAYECGFSSESHFIHSFKSRMGISPYQYSKTLKASIK